MNSSEFISSGIIEAYVMGLCTPEEKAEVEKMRLQHADVNQSIIEFEEELEKQFTTNPTKVSATTDEKIISTFAEKQNIQAPVKKINWFKPAMAAALVLLITSAIFNFTLRQTNKDLEKKLIATQNNTTLPITDYNILKDPTITPVAMNGVGIHTICRCTMFWDKKTGKAYIMIHHLVPSNENTNYQMWANVNGKQVSVGIINDKIRDRFIEVNNVPKDATGFSVTLEKVGGSNTPTIEETYLIGRI